MKMQEKQHEEQRFPQMEQDIQTIKAGTNAENYTQKKP